MAMAAAHEHEIVEGNQLLSQAASSALRWVKSDQAAGVAASASVAAGWLHDRRADPARGRRPVTG